MMRILFGILAGAGISLLLGILLCSCAHVETCHAKVPRGRGVCPRTREWELRFKRLTEAHQCLVDERICLDDGYLCVLDDEEVYCE